MTRKRWVYRKDENGEMQAIEILSDAELQLRLNAPVIGDMHYEGLRGPQGEDISTRTKHKEFLKASGLALADDYKNEWAQAQKQRDAFQQGASSKDRREQLARAFHQQFNR
jgi:hypothetical protein